MGKAECPRCGMHTMKDPIGKNAISNEDNKTYICSNCGINENRIAFFRAKGNEDNIDAHELELSKKFKEKLKNGRQNFG